MLIMCHPKNFKLIHPINKSEEKYFKKGIDKDLLIKQFENCYQCLKEKSDIILLDPHPLLPEQVFTRDVAIKINDKFYAAKMATSIRQNEVEQIGKKVALLQNDFGFIEGGDVVSNNKITFIGYGNRTSKNTIKNLQKKFNFFPVKLKNNTLHLDCTLNLLENYAIVYKKGIDFKSKKILKKFFKIIPINREEFQNLNTNFIVLDKTIFIGNCSDRLCQLFTELGYKVTNLDMSEFIKLGGSVRCITQEI